MPERKGVQRSVRAANINIEPEDLLHDDPIGIVLWRYKAKTYDFLK